MTLRKAFLSQKPNDLVLGQKVTITILTKMLIDPFISHAAQLGTH